MSALGVPVLINSNRAYWLSSIGTDVTHSTIITDTIDANLGNISTLNAEQVSASTMTVSTLNLQNLDVSGMYVSTIRGNTAFFSTMTLASDLSGGLGYVRFSVDASGIQVDGDPIRFDNLVYLTSTINIIQVSTLVDTDIFAQNGYFSTLSSGSLSTGLLQGRQAFLSSIVCDDISGNNASFDTLFVSTLEALDISGVAASNWSLYPTLNSSITFQPGFVLSNVGPTLFFAGIELTDVSGGGQDWSRFPAVSTVQMANNSITGLSTLQYQDGARLYSQTGNNLFYNGQPIQFGAASNVSQWANYPAVSNVNMNGSNLSNAALIAGSNLTLSGSNITNGNTFTNSLGVGGTSLVSLATITSGGDLTCRNIDVGDSVTGVADVNIYGGGPTVLPGDSALYVQGGVQFDGGAIHGFAAGVLPVAGINTGRMELLTAGFNILHPAVGAITTGAAMSLTAGGAISMAAGGYLELNTSTLQMINTSQGNKNTTIQAGYLTVDPDVAPTSSIKLFNTLGGGVEIDGGGQGSLVGFSTLIANNISSFSTNTTTLRANLTNTSTLLYNFGLGLSSIISNLGVNNIKIADDITGVTNAPFPLEARIVNFSSINSFNMSTTDLWVSSINGAAPGSGSGGSINNFSTLTASSFTVSTITGYSNPNTFIGNTAFVDTGLQFIGAPVSAPSAGRFLSSLRYINSPGDDVVFTVSTLNLLYQQGVNPDGYIRLGGGSAFDSFFLRKDGLQTLSTQTVQALSSFVRETVVSTIGAQGGLPIKAKSIIQFDGTGGIDNCAAINLGQQINLLTLRASTILMDTNNARVPSFSTLGLSTGGFSFSTASNYLSNANFNFPLYIEHDAAGNISTAGSAIVVAGHSFQNGAARHELHMGWRSSDAANYIQAVWPGQNLEDLVIEGDPVIISDGAVSTIFNTAPYTIQTAGAVAVGLGAATVISSGVVSTPSLLVSSINGYDARPALTNNLMLSTMELYAASTTLMYWDSTTVSDNINTSGYDVVVGVNGTYKIGSSFQFISPGAADEVEFFVLKNDSVISQSGGIVEVANNAEIIQYAEVLEPLVNGDKIQIGCYTTNSNVYVSTINGNVIQSPAVILTMYKVN